MKINKLKEVSYDDNDAYFLKKCGPFIGLNKSYRHFEIYDFDLNRINLINFKKKVLITSDFFSKDGKNCALYDYDNQQFVFFDISHNEAFYLKLPRHFHHAISFFYFWIKDTLVIVCENGKLLKISDKKIPSILDQEVARSSFPDIYDFVAYTKKYERIFQISYELKSFISAENGIITFHNLSENRTFTTSEPNNNYHDIIFSNGFFAIIAEKEIIIKNEQDAQIIPTKDLEWFLRGVFINEENKLFFYLLSSNFANHRLSKIMQYEIQLT